MQVRLAVEISPLKRYQIDKHIATLTQTIVDDVVAELNIDLVQRESRRSRQGGCHSVLNRAHASRIPAVTP